MGKLLSILRSFVLPTLQPSDSNPVALRQGVKFVNNRCLEYQKGISVLPQEFERRISPTRHEV